VQAAPSAGLWNGQTDEKELGLKYAVLDKILEKLVGKNGENKQIKVAAVAKELGVEAAVVKKVQKMVFSSAHKRQTPPVAPIA
jgi:NAD+ synthase